MPVTDVAEVAKLHGIQEIVLPGWGPEAPFVCRVRKPTLYNMASTGVIPNPLLETVQQLFMASAKKIEKISLEKQANALIQMARYALVEPTLDDLVAAGLTLTDEQLLALYAFAIGGAAALAPFCQGVCQRPDGDGQDVQDAAQSNSGR